jgi:hypothetical protein
MDDMTRILGERLLKLEEENARLRAELAGEPDPDPGQPEARPYAEMTMDEKATFLQQKYAPGV